MKKFSDVENLYRETEIYDNGRVVVTEKLHGTNIRIGFMWEDNKFFIGGRNTIFTEFSAPTDYGVEVDVESLNIENDSYGFTRWFLKNYPLVPSKMSGIGWAIHENIIIYGEFIGSGIQKGIDYGNEKSFWVFSSCAVENSEADEAEWKPWLQTYEYVKALGLKRVPVLYAGDPDKEVFDKLYELDSTVARILGVETTPNICEGIVIVPEAGNVRDKYGSQLIIKHKNKKFEEKKSEKKEKPLVDQDAQSKAQDFVDTYVVPERLNHVLQHLYEDQQIMVSDMTKTKLVIDEMLKDLQKECGPELAEVDTKMALNLAGKRTAQLLKESLC